MKCFLYSKIIEGNIIGFFLRVTLDLESRTSCKYVILNSLLLCNKLRRLYWHRLAPHLALKMTAFTLSTCKHCYSAYPHDYEQIKIQDRNIGISWESCQVFKKTVSFMIKSEFILWSKKWQVYIPNLVWFHCFLEARGRLERKLWD